MHHRRASYWWLAVERLAIYLRRLIGKPEPWTEDLILREYKFTNTFRAADRVSQYCIRNVIYEGGSMDPQEVVYRVAFFKLFNSIPAWETLTAAFGPLTWENFDAAACGDLLGKAKDRGVKIWNAAYMQKPQTGTKLVGKHNNYLSLLERMMRSGIADKLQSAKTYEEAYRVFRDFPSPAIGDFTAMQLVTDINYSPILNFSENDFIIPGPGALDGINKCFRLSLSKDRPRDLLTATEIIKYCVEHQEDLFRKYDLEPVTLFGRRLHLIDCQSLFCETDKYSRVKHPEFNLKRSEIKQKFRVTGLLPAPFFPPKWGLII
jgi:hypothetical protein